MPSNGVCFALSTPSRPAGTARTTALPGSSGRPSARSWLLPVPIWQSAGDSISCGVCASVDCLPTNRVLLLQASPIAALYNPYLDLPWISTIQTDHQPIKKRPCLTISRALNFLAYGIWTAPPLLPKHFQVAVTDGWKPSSPLFLANLLVNKQSHQKPPGNTPENRGVPEGRQMRRNIVTPRIENEVVKKITQHPGLHY